jgi:cytochrome P450
MTQMTVPTSDLDIFQKDILTDPYPAYEELREAGPVVWLERYKVWAFARYGVVRAALLDHETFYSSAGTGLTDLRTEASWRTPSRLQEADPPEHTRWRSIIGSVFTMDSVRPLTDAWFAEARELVGAVAGAGEFDGISRLAQALPLRVFADQVGLPREGREQYVPPFAEMAFNLNGPHNELYEESMRSAQAVLPWIIEHLYPEKLAPGGWGSQIHQLATAEGFSREEAAIMVRGVLVAGMDTTIKGLGSLLWYLAANPGQYAALRGDPRLIRPALDEAVRLESPIQMFFRTVSRDFDADGVTVPSGDRVVLLFGAANRDPRRWDDPDRFDITRKAAGNLAFGAGIHGCLGRMIAHVQAEALLTALARAAAGIELAGPVRWRLNNTVRGLAELPLRLIPATP